MLDLRWSFLDPTSISIRILIFVIGRVLVCLSRFFEVRHSTVAGPISTVDRVLSLYLNIVPTLKEIGRAVVEWRTSKKRDIHTNTRPITKIDILIRSEKLHCRSRIVKNWLKLVKSVTDILFGSDQDIDFRDRPCINVSVSFLEVPHSTTACSIRFKPGTMFNYKLNSWSMVEFFGSDQSRFIEVRRSTRRDGFGSNSDNAYFWRKFSIFFPYICHTFLKFAVAGAQLFRQKNLSWKSYH